MTSSICQVNDSLGAWEMSGDDVGSCAIASHWLKPGECVLITGRLFHGSHVWVIARGQRMLCYMGDIRDKVEYL